MKIRFACIMILIFAVSTICAADEAYLVIVSSNQDKIAEYPGRCWGRTMAATYLYATASDLTWLEANTIDYRSHEIDIDLYPVLYLNYGDVAQMTAGGGEFLDIAPDYVLAKSRLPQAKQAKLFKPRRLPLGETDTGRFAFRDYDTLIDSLIGEVDIDSLMDRLEKLSGEESVVVGGQTVTIDTRYSGTDDNSIAAQYIYETLQGYGYDVEYDAFYDGGLRHVACSGSNNAWVADENSEALRTLDGGSDWDYMNDNTTANLWGVESVGLDSIWVAGSQGTVLFSSDAGTSLAQQTTPSSNYLFGICFISPAEGWIAGDYGTVLHTTNGGQNWNSQSTSTSSRLYDVCFTDSNNGWAVGRDGVIIHSTNGGASWTAQSSGTTERLYSIEFTSSSDGWAVGWNGTVLKTTDGGSNWSSLSLGDNIEKYHVDFPSASYGYIVGWEGGIFKTTNGGTNWIQQSSGVSNNLYGVEFSDNLNGYAVGNGVILKTTDGGSSWVNQSGAIDGVWRNVIGTKYGTINDDQDVIICAHFDNTSQYPTTDAPGADDNGSGTVGVLEAARLFSGTDFEKNIKFCLWTGEEQGLLGSEVYANQAYNAGQNIVGAFNFDMIGYDGNSDHHGELHCGTMASSIALGNLFTDVIADYSLNLSMLFLTSGSTDRSDHASFWDYGYPAILGIEDFSADFNPYYHTTNDNVTIIDQTFFAEFAKAAMASTATMAIPAGAQSYTGEISGNVSDPLAQPLNNVHVTMTGSSANDYSDGSGNYSLFGLNTGTYDVHFSLAGYRDTTVTAVSVTDGATTSLDMQMQELEEIPTLSEWGLIILSLLTLTGLTMATIRRYSVSSA